MDIREPIPYDHLSVSIIPDEEKEIFLTGERPSFKAKIENPTDRKRKGAMIFTWHLGPNATARPIVFDIPAKGVKEYRLEKEWLCQPGPAIYRLPLIAGKEYELRKPEELLKEFEEFKGDEIKEEGSLGFIPPQITTVALNSSFHTLCQYRVEDRATFEHEEIRRTEEKTFTKRMTALTWAIVAMTAVMFFAILPRFLDILVYYLHHLL